MGDDDCQCDEGAPAWMATFSDLATLLLTFFVLLLSFAELDITEFKVMLGSIKDAFGVNTIDHGPFAARSSQPIDLLGNPTSLTMPLNDLESSLMRPIRGYVARYQKQDQVELEITDRGVIVRLRDKVLFESGSDQVKSEGKEILGLIAKLATAFPDGLSVEGHTDDRPIQTGRFPSNWELSAARATSVLQVLQKEKPLPVEALRVVGFADTKPIAPNDSRENRARNRRVEFVFERPRQRPDAPEDELDAAANAKDGEAKTEETSEAEADVDAEPTGSDNPGGSASEEEPAEDLSAEAEPDRDETPVPAAKADAKS